MTGEPVFIVGPVRSGTTLLRWALDSHPHIACRSEQNFLWPLIAMFRDRFLTENGESFDSAKLSQLRRSQDMRLEPPEIARLFRHLHEAFYLDICRRLGKSRWADGTHTILDRNLPAVDTLYDHKPLYLVLLRDGLDVAVSMREKFGHEIAANLDYWCDVVELHRTFADRNASRCFPVRYEDLVENPQAVLDSIFRFLGEEPVAAIEERIFQLDHGPAFGDHKITRTRRVLNSSVSRWQAHPLADLKAAVAGRPRFRDLMTQVGYQVP